MPKDILAQQLLLPEMKLLKVRRGQLGVDFVVEMTSSFEVCPKCATKSRSVYDHRWAVVKDTPLRNAQARFVVRKRRFICRPCGKPFTEPVHGVLKGKRTTERYARAVTEACEQYVDLSRVRKKFRCSAGYLYSSLYRHIRLKQREKRTDWPRKVGLDEHSFKRGKGFNRSQFVTMVVDQSNGRLMEVAEGRQGADVEQAVSRFKHPENVRWVSIDLCVPYRRFVEGHFPNAQIVADKFHVLRLLSGPLMKHRRLATNGQYNPYLRWLLLKPGYYLPHKWRAPLHEWLSEHADLQAIYRAKEQLSRFYRISSRRQASRELTRMTDEWAHSELPELQTLRKTLIKWRSAILNYWACRLTNARVEGFNNKAKLVKRRAYGYKSFSNYRLRLLNACGS